MDNKISFTGGRFGAFLKKISEFDYSSGEGFDLTGYGDYIYNLTKIDDCQFKFNNKHNPLIVEFYRKARNSSFSFILEYEDLSRNIFGITIYDRETKEANDFRVPEREFSKLNWDDDGNVYDEEKTIANLYDWLKEKLDIEMNKRVECIY